LARHDSGFKATQARRVGPETNPSTACKSLFFYVW
jgi:hypothetical protein